MKLLITSKTKPLIIFYLLLLVFGLTLSKAQSKKTKLLNINKNQQQKQQKQLHQSYYFSNNDCYHKYFQKQKFDSAPTFCYLFTLSRVLSLITIAIAFIIKIPQIYMIYKQKSVFGITYFGSNLQFIMYSLTVSYGIYGILPLSVYVQNVFLSIQSLIIVLLFFKYQKQDPNSSNKKRLIFLMISVLVSLVFVFQFVPVIFQRVSIWLQLLVFVFGRGSQLVKNHISKSTGNLSKLMMQITIFCNLSRVFSIAVQTPEQLAYLMNYLLPFVMNSYILLQFYLYGKSNSNKCSNSDKYKFFKVSESVNQIND